MRVLCPHCGRRPVVRAGRCEECLRRRELATRLLPRQKKRPYVRGRDGLREDTEAWRRLRRAFMARPENQFCAACAGVGQTTPARVADHIYPWGAFPDKRYDEGNLQPLCVSDHAVKTARERYGEYIDYRRRRIIKLSDREFRAARARAMEYWAWRKSVRVPEGGVAGGGG